MNYDDFRDDTWSTLGFASIQMVGGSADGMIIAVQDLAPERYVLKGKYDLDTPEEFSTCIQKEIYVRLKDTNIYIYKKSVSPWETT